MSLARKGQCMTIRFDKDDKKILFRYEPEYSFDVICAKLCIDFDGSDSIRRYTPETLPDELEQKRPSTQDDASVTIKRVFTFLQDDLIDEMCESLTETLVFKFAVLDEANLGYFRVNGRVFNCKQDILLATNLQLDWRLFCVGYERRTSVIKRIASTLDDSEAFIAIGGDDERAIPEETFKELRDGFPTTAILEHYGDAQIESYIQDYLSLKKRLRGAIRAVPRAQANESVLQTWKLDDRRKQDCGAARSGHPATRPFESGEGRSRGKLAERDPMYTARSVPSIRCRNPKSKNKGHAYRQEAGSGFSACGRFG